MPLDYYTGRVDVRGTDVLRELPPSPWLKYARPERYLPDPGLVDAVNVALLLGQPLLLTGEPGTGKTQLAYSLAWQLGFEAPLKFETKSTSEAKDLFYTYDALRRFQAAQTSSGSTDGRDYLSFAPLGHAILRATEDRQVREYLLPEDDHAENRRSIVLIDEIDKAPRDFPNDLLNEIDEMYFRIPELASFVVRADPCLKPIVVITSNSEKDLPDAFLRRCIYYHIPFPDADRLREIVLARLESFAGRDTFLGNALAFFERLRQPLSGLQKRPATAELLGWLQVLRQAAPDVDNPMFDRNLVKSSLCCLVKNAEDQNTATRIWEEWMSKPT